MTSIAKLKDRARKLEQKEDWVGAIAAYQKVLETEEGETELELELGLFNRIGDLYLRLGQTDPAVNYYEQAADKYADAGFFNNAIALCNKALRHRPDRARIYLKLSRLCAEQGFVTDARRWILEYAEREVRAGHVDDALAGLSDFVATSDDPDVREFLAKQLATHGREEEAAEQYAVASAERTERGETEEAERAAEQARALDPDIDLDAVASAHSEAADDALDEFPEDEEDEEDGSTGMKGLETRPDSAVGEVDVAGVEGLESAGGAPADVQPEEGEGLAGLEVSYSERAPAAEPEDADGATLGGLETFDTVDEEAEEAEEEPEPLPMLDVEPPDVDEEAEEEAEPLPMLDFGSPTDEEPEDEAPEDEAPAVEAVPDEEEEPGADSILERARALVESNRTDEALRELSLLDGDDPGDDVLRDALAIVTEITRREPDDVSAHQRRVELAARTGDDPLQLDAFLALAGALDRQGAETKARAMYERVLGLDPGNAEALEALGRDDQADAPEAVDLDGLLRDLNPDALSSADAVPDEVSDPEFVAMLSEFKARVVEGGPTEDAGDHYDLGLAFKEMGLLDEAVAEFQTALAGGEERLKVYEELGQCYILKNQYTVALKIFHRALQVPHEDEADLLGVYYHLGQCHEELGQREQARESYEKVLSIDPAFQDVPDRVARL